MKKSIILLLGITMSVTPAFAETFQAAVSKIDALKIGTFQIAYSMRDEKNMCPVEFICDDENAPKDNRPEVIFGAAFLFQGVRLNNTAVYFHKRGECYGIVDEIQKKLKSGKVTIEFNSDKILSIKN